MGYASSTIQEGNADDGFSSAMYDAQFKPSSSNLPPLGNIASSFGGAPAQMDSNVNSVFKPSFGILFPPAPKPTPKPVIPTVIPVGVSPFGTGTVTGIISAPAPTPPQGIINQITNSPIQDTGLPALPTTALIPPSTTTAQNNATALQQQSQQAAAGGNSSLAAALAAQAQNWQSMASGLATGSVVSPLSADNPTDITAPVSSTPAVAKAGLLGNIKPVYLLAAAAAALFLVKK